MSDKFKELLAKIEDPELKSGLLDEYSAVNRLKGEYGLKLTEKDNALKELKDQTSSWSAAFTSLKKNGIEPDKIPAILEKLNISKTQEEEYNLTKVSLTELQGKLRDAEKTIGLFKAKEVVGKAFEKERAELKDTSGKVIKLADRFIDYDKLYDIADLGNETVIQEKIKTVLTQAVATQTEVLRDVGFQGVTVHKANTDGTPNDHQILDIKEVMEKQGPVAAIAAMHANNATRK